MRRISEEATRKELIDASTLPSVAAQRPQLEIADWYLRDHTKVRIEIPVDGYDPI